jgi:hypothetical protein
MFNIGAKRPGRYILGAVALSVGGLILPITLDKRPACKRVGEWVRAHAQELPETLPELRAYPANYRRQIVASLPTATRTRLWAEHLNAAIEEPWDEAQRKLMVEVRTLMSDPSFFSPENADRAEALDQRVRPAFSPADYRRIFEDLGPASGSWEGLGSARILVSERLQRILSPPAVASGNCECRGTRLYCPVFPEPWVCQLGGCTPVQCGMGGTQICNGICVP